MHVDPKSIGAGRGDFGPDSNSDAENDPHADAHDCRTGHACVSSASSIAPRRREWVKVNVGGTCFTTTVSTLCADRESLLFLLVQAEIERMAPVDKDPDCAILLDLDPLFFAPILNYLRHKVLIIPPGVPASGVLAVAEYLNLEGVMRQLAPERHTKRQLLYSWGSGASGELGTQNFHDCNIPTLVAITPFGVRVVDVALGANYSCALSDDGNIYAFGNGDWGQLGLGPPHLLDEHPDDKSAVVTVPQRIPLFERNPALYVAAGYAYAMALTTDHHVYFWGNNNHGQSGLGPRYFDYSLRKVEEPTLVETLEGKRIVQLGCGSFFSLALGDDGTLYSWGLLECMGLGSLEEVRATIRDPLLISESLSAEKRTVVLVPQVVRVPTEHKLVRVHAGQWHSGAINAAGELFTWGIGYQGRLGHGDKEPALFPTRVRGALTGQRVVDVACGSFHTVALTDHGAVYCWGDNASGQCGAKTSVDAVTSPYRVVNLEFVAGGVAKGISCGRQHSVVVMHGPQPWCQRPCCKLDHNGRPMAPHGQVFTFGETGRSGGSGAGSSTTCVTRLQENKLYRQFRLVPSLKDLNVTNVKSGLHHTFVFAEELTYATSSATFGGGAGGWMGTTDVMDNLCVQQAPPPTEWMSADTPVTAGAIGRKVRRGMEQ